MRNVSRIFAENFATLSVETLPKATRFTPEPMEFLFEETFGNDPKLGVAWRKVRTFGVFDTFVVKFRKL